MKPRRINPQPFHLFVEALAGQAEGVGRGGDLSVVFGQHLLDEGFFGAGEHLIEAVAGFEDGVLGCLQKRRRCLPVCRRLEELCLLGSTARGIQPRGTRVIP